MWSRWWIPLKNCTSSPLFPRHLYSRWWSHSVLQYNNDQGGHTFKTVSNRGGRFEVKATVWASCCFSLTALHCDSDSNSPIEKIIMTGLGSGSGWAEQALNGQRAVTIIFQSNCRAAGLVFSFMTRLEIEISCFFQHMTVASSMYFYAVWFKSKSNNCTVL